MFFEKQTQRLCYCRGQRQLDLQQNFERGLWIIIFIGFDEKDQENGEILTALQYKGANVYSPETAKTFTLYIKHKQIHIEMLIGSIIYNHIAMPLISYTTYHLINEGGAAMATMMDLMIARCGLNEPLYWLISVIFGYQWVVFDDLSANQYLHSKGGFRLRLWADEEHSMPYDKLPTLTEEEKEAEQEWWASLKQRELIEAENPSFNLQACLPDIKEDDSQRINLFRVQDAHDLNVRLVLLFVGNFYK